MRILLPVLVGFPSARAPALQSAHMAQALAELGHDVTVVAPAPAGPDELPVDLAARPGTAGGAAADEVAVDALLEELTGVRPAFRTVTLARRIHRGQSLPHSLRVARLARRLGSELVLTRDLRAALLPARAGIATVLELHTLTTIARPVDRLVLRALRRSRGFRGIVAISAPLAEDLAVLHGIDPAEVLVAHDAVRLGPDPAPPVGPRAPDAPLRVGYTGSLYPGKGVETVVTLAERCPWAEFHVAGGPDRLAGSLREDRARDLANLTVHGLLPHAAVRALQQDCDVLLAPFATEVRSDSGVDISRWTSPLKVFEYLASGRPMLVADLPVLRDVVTAERTALVAPPGDVDAFALALRRLHDDPALRERLGRAGREDATARWTWEARATRILTRFADPLEQDGDPT